MKLFTRSNTLAFAIAAIGLTSASSLMAQNEAQSPPIVITSSAMDLGGILGASDGSAFIGGAPSFMGGASLGGDDAFSMLRNESVQKDLELVGDQLDEVNKLRADFQLEMQSEIQGLLSGNQLDSQGLHERLMELQAEQKAKIESMLLPHQLERLKQVKLQMQMKRKGTSQALVNKEVAEALGIDSEQKKRIKKRAVELKKELEERTKELQEEIRNKLLEELTSEQKLKLKELSGEKFEHKEQNIGEVIRARMEKMKKSENN